METFRLEAFVLTAGGALEETPTLPIHRLPAGSPCQRW
jgi:hypothetical protein